jgi:hypothetical protein
MALSDDVAAARAAWTSASTYLAVLFGAAGGTGRSDLANAIYKMCDDKQPAAARIAAATTVATVAAPLATATTALDSFGAADVGTKCGTQLSTLATHATAIAGALA